MECPAGARTCVTGHCIVHALAQVHTHRKTHRPLRPIRQHRDFDGFRGVASRDPRISREAIAREQRADVRRRDQVRRKSAPIDAHVAQERRRGARELAHHDGLDALVGVDEFGLAATGTRQPPHQELRGAMADAEGEHPHRAGVRGHRRDARGLVADLSVGQQHELARKLPRLRRQRGLQRRQQLGAAHVRIPALQGPGRLVQRCLRIGLAVRKHHFVAAAEPDDVEGVACLHRTQRQAQRIQRLRDAAAGHRAGAVQQEDVFARLAGKAAGIGKQVDHHRALARAVLRYHGMGREGLRQRDVHHEVPVELHVGAHQFDAHLVAVYRHLRGMRGTAHGLHALRRGVIDGQ